MNSENPNMKLGNAKMAQALIAMQAKAQELGETSAYMTVAFDYWMENAASFSLLPIQSNAGNKMAEYLLEAEEIAANIVSSLPVFGAELRRKEVVFAAGSDNEKLIFACVVTNCLNVANNGEIAKVGASTFKAHVPTVA